MNKIIDQITRARKIIIAGHVNPDGDCIGSMLALGLGLESIGKEVSMYIAGKLPRIYDFLPGSKKISNSTNFKAELAIAVDCNCREMLGPVYPAFCEAKTIAAIDHHEYRRAFSHIRFLDYKASCVGEMVYKVLKKMKVAISKDIATNILTSLLIETNSFRFPSVNKNSFKLAQRLLEHGVDYNEIVNNLFFSTLREVAVLSGICMARCKFANNGKIVWSEIYKDDFKQQRGKDEHVDAVADQMRSIKGVEAAFLFREKNSLWLRVSLRSKNKVNVALLAEAYGGGGHFDVAGCVIKNSQKEINRFLSDAKRLLQTGKI